MTVQHPLPFQNTQCITCTVFNSVHLDNGTYAGFVPGQGAVPLYVAFSGGRSSAYMTEILLRDYGHMYSPIYITFANTGQEHEMTLQFVFACQKRWERLYNTTVVWLEAKVNKKLRKVKGAGTRYTVVDFFSATRNTEYRSPFTDVIDKYGLPSPTSKNVCNRELKLAPQNSFRRDLEVELGVKGIYTAVGLRGDEPERHDSVEKQRIGQYCYPMLDLFYTEKEDVLDFWSEDMPFDLELTEELGNCLTCWKKSNKKLFKVAEHRLNNYWFFDLHQQINSRTNLNSNPTERRFFRGHLTPANIVEIAILGADIDDLKAQARDFILAQAAQSEREMLASGSCTEECQAAPSVQELAELNDELEGTQASFPLLPLFSRREPVLNWSM